MNPILVIMTMIWKGGDIRVMRCIIPSADQFAVRGLQVIPVLGARYD